MALVRGVVSLVEALKLGSARLRFSAEIYEQDLEEAEAQSESSARQRRSAGRPTAGRARWRRFRCRSSRCSPHEPELPHPVLPPDGASKDGGVRKLFTCCRSCSRSGCSWRCRRLSRRASSRIFGLGLDVREPLFQLLTGAAKLTIVVGYMLAIRRMPEIYRVFQYHGAEHKSIYTYECGRRAERRERAHQDHAAPALRHDVSRDGGAGLDLRVLGARSVLAASRRSAPCRERALLLDEAAVPAGDRRHHLRDSARARPALPRARSAPCSGRVFWCRRSPRSSPTTSSSRSRSRRCASRCVARTERGPGKRPPAPAEDEIFAGFAALRDGTRAAA